MTPQERQLIDDLFDRLAKVESAPRDAEAMSAIMQGLRNAPNAIYPLVQTVLLQDEALRRAGERIQQLEQGQAQDQGQAGGFLDSMRDKIFGQSNQPRGSVPNVPPPVPESRPVWNSGQVLQQTQNPSQGQGQYDQRYGQGNYQGNYQGSYGGPGYGQGPYGGPQSPFGGGGSFLGTAAATAAGVIGGSLLMNSIRGMMGGGHHHQAFGDSTLAGSPSPWGGDQSGSSAARDLGVNDVGPASNHADDSGRRAGLFDTASNDGNDRDDMDMDSDDFGGDNDSDYA
jgi:uncharacterized protein